jgi:hypothetical protein
LPTDLIIKKINLQSLILGCKVRESNFTTNDHGRATGECFVVLESQEDVDIAKNFHQNNLGSRMYLHSECEIYLPLIRNVNDLQQKDRILVFFL